MSKVSLQSQISAVETAISGKSAGLRQSAVELHQDHLKAAAQSLRFLQRYEADIRALVTSKRGAAS